MGVPLKSLRAVQDARLHDVTNQEAPSADMPLQRGGNKVLVYD